MYSYLKKLLKLIPKKLYPYGATLYNYVHPLRRKIKLIPSKNFWIIQDKNRKLFIPPALNSFSRFSNGINNRIKNVYRKYTFSPYVEIEKGDVICDVGAFIGEFSIISAQKGRQVIAFEPDPLAYYCLRRNTTLLDNVAPYKRLLWNCEKKLDFKISTAQADSSVFNVDSKKVEERIKVQGRKLDKEVLEMGYKNIDFLKVEAEGGEYEVLEGADSVLQNTRKIAVDCSPERHGKSPQKEIRDLLKDYEFKTARNKINKPYPAIMVYGWKNT